MKKSIFLFTFLSIFLSQIILLAPVFAKELTATDLEKRRAQFKEHQAEIEQEFDEMRKRDVIKNNYKLNEKINLAEKGDVQAQLELAKSYISGYNSNILSMHGVKPNNEEALKWFQKAADQENKGAQMGLAILYLEGRGVEKKLNLGKKWLNKAFEEDRE